jgi:hypothetical protein
LQPPAAVRANGAWWQIIGYFREELDDTFDQVAFLVFKVEAAQTGAGSSYTQHFGRADRPGEREHFIRHGHRFIQKHDIRLRCRTNNYSD